MKDAKMKDANKRAGDGMESLGLYKQEKIGDHGLAKGNDGESGNQVPVRKREPLADGFTIK